MENFKTQKIAYRTKYFRMLSLTKNGKLPGSYTYDVEFQIVQDSPRLKYHVGDIIKFNNLLYVVPIYARNEYAIIINKYRWVKHKRERTYCDYGNEIMMLTGDKIGHNRRYYTSTPWKKVKKSNQKYEELEWLAQKIKNDKKEHMI